MLRVTIVDPSEATRDPLRSLLLGIDFVFLETECSRYEFFLDVLQESRHSLPDLAIVNLDADKTKSLNLIAQVVHDHPRLPILVISADHQVILQSLQRGAKHFLTTPVVLEDLLVTLRKVQGESHQGDRKGAGPAASLGSRGSQIIALLGSRGGVGCTTLAVNIASTLAADPAHSVALVDLDLALGDCDVALDIMPDHTIADLAMNIDKLDLNFMRRSMLKHAPTHLHLLAHPLQMSDVGAIQPPHVERILNLLKINFSHLVLDLSKGLSPCDLVGLDMADIILVVAQLELSSLRNVVRMLMTLSATDGIAEKIRVVINRVGSDMGEAAIGLKKAEETLGKPIFWQIPNDSKPVLSARLAGEPLVRHAPKSRAQLSLQGLAAAIANKPTFGSVPVPSAPAGFMKGLFGKR